jgi:hypothetical protein
MNGYELMSNKDLLKLTRITKKELYEQEWLADARKGSEAGKTADEKAKYLLQRSKEDAIELNRRGLKDQEFKDKHDYYILAKDVKVREDGEEKEYDL